MGGSYTRQVFIVWNSSLTGHSAFYFLHLFLCTKYANPTRGVGAFGRGRGKEKEERKKKPLPKPWRKREGSSEEVMAERRLGDVREQESMLSRRNISFLESVRGDTPGPPPKSASPQWGKSPRCHQECQDVSLQRFPGATAPKLSRHIARIWYIC